MASHADWPLLCGWAASAALALLYLLPMPSALRRWLDPIARMGKVDPSGPQAGSEKRRSADTWWSRLSVPRWFFDTFYVVGFLVAALALLGTALVVGRPGSHCGQLQLAVLSLFWLHVTRRLAETLSLTTHRPGSRIHVAAWAIGTLYYVAMPWTLAGATCSTQAVESLVAAGPALSTVLTATGSLPRTATAAIAAIVAGAPVASSVALALFVTGQVVQAWVHYKLAIVRSGLPPGTYVLPKGGPFEWVACPHYTAEIISYVGLALPCLLQPASPVHAASILAVLGFVVGNLSVSALGHLAWYRAKFQTPPHWKAVFPFVY